MEKKNTTDKHILVTGLAVDRVEICDMGGGKEGRNNKTKHSS